MNAPRHHLPRWTLSLALVLGLHIGICVLALNWRNAALAVELPPPAALLVELAPLPAVAPPPPAPAAQPEPTPLPPPVVAPKPRLVLEKPRPKTRPTPAKPVLSPLKPQPPTLAKAAPPTPSAPSTPAAPTAAAVSSAASQAAKQSWQSHLLGHLARYKRYPEHARRRGIEGTSQVRFRLDGHGRVLSVALARSSGNAALDRATLAMIRRASPVPKPPAELLNGDHLEIVAPFIYNLERG